MSYEARVTSADPVAVIFLIDQSDSMRDSINSEGLQKQHAVADALNNLLRELSIMSSRSGHLKDYFYVSVVGYGAHVGSTFGGALAGRDLVPISEVAENPLLIDERMKKVPDGAGGLVEQRIRFPIWVEPAAANGTPMCAVFMRAAELVNDFANAHPDSFPPIVFNLTDGEATDGDFRGQAEAVRSIKTNDGATLICNLHVQTAQRGVTTLRFPSDISHVHDQLAHQLFEISSVMPEPMREEAELNDYKLDESARCFVFNGDVTDVVRFLKVGTVATLR